MVQTMFVKAELERLYPGIDVQVCGMTTAGDQILNQPLSAFTDKGVFTKELDVSLLTHQTEIAVHSLKDLTTILPDGLALAAIVERVHVEDVVLVHPRHRANGVLSLSQLPPGSIVGTSSLRRRALLARLHPHVRVVDIRGNLQTRWTKLESGAYDALLLAQAGVQRLGWHDRIAETLPSAIFPHAVGQAALGIVCRADDARSMEFLQPLDHRVTHWRCAAERALLRQLEGGCKVPIATSTVLDEASAQLTLRGVVISLDGQTIVDHTLSAVRALVGSFLSAVA